MCIDFKLENSKIIKLQLLPKFVPLHNSGRNCTVVVFAFATFLNIELAAVLAAAWLTFP